MKPINSRERTKQVWQFIFIFFALAVIPVALIFFSYYQVPEQISELENRKLNGYSRLEHTQKQIIEKMIMLDTNLRLLANTYIGDEQRLKDETKAGIFELAQINASDTLLQYIAKSYSNHFYDVSKLRVKTNEASDCATKVDKLNRALDLARNPFSGGLPTQAQGN